MQHFENWEYDINDPSLVSVCDELPLWSAPFGLKLLDTIEYRPDMNVLDIGCGTGFPLLELAGRLGRSCRVYGIDPWKTAVERIRLKLKVWKIQNVEVIHGVAERMPFDDRFFHLIVSNNGINNVDDPEEVLSECFRVARPGCQLVVTVNLPDTMIEFYNMYEETLQKLGKTKEVAKMNEHISARRKPLDATKKMLIDAGFELINVVEDSFKMKFLDGSALMQHPSIKLAFLEPWKGILQENDVEEVFGHLVDRLNSYANAKGELSLTVPLACIDSRKK
ncbi:MAG: methyltransferase domain-containing protein [Candidatus Latescibacteria bacterium]|nr:methyltransferase domain-containing protein [Candidatus Latescibacterota bacterium]NIM22014.1 methyltransferase domain-containing protein [Candidatus Latescibacterota bacterium]NIM66032.1 methyltransferase domain-containing protein [Candidatus Latescibacterota bacterium]NIO02440.1 methyltransferase domain-containing protein [Candidatus Latescibacterota bacterium]NIO29351.1 methyltransferase domain-containing protein [Candidatus Latescibacterota bacterium]